METVSFARISFLSTPRGGSNSTYCVTVNELAPIRDWESKFDCPKEGSNKLNEVGSSLFIKLVSF